MTARRNFVVASALVWVIGLLGTRTLGAEEKSPEERSNLPGVQGTYRIVKPIPPEPEPDTAPDDDRYGRWDVTVSGKWTVDIGTGELPPPRE